MSALRRTCLYLLIALMAFGQWLPFPGGGMVHAASADPVFGAQFVAVDSGHHGPEHGLNFATAMGHDVHADVPCHGDQAAESPADASSATDEPCHDITHVCCHAPVAGLGSIAVRFAPPVGNAFAVNAAAGAFSSRFPDSLDRPPRTPRA